MQSNYQKYRQTSNLKEKLLISAAMFVSCMYPGSLLAQQVAEEEEAPVDTVIVVGSQIRGSSVTAALPVTSLGQAEISAVGAASMDDLIRTLPGSGNMSFGASGQNSVAFGVNGARGDVASINLRNLGAGNTLVLLNGRRLVHHAGTQTNEQTVPEQTININQIPIAGINRVEILRDGAAAIYGTDAVAGVMNTILKDDYEGLEVSSRYGSSFGTGMDEHTMNMIAGFKVNNDRTRITFSANRYERDGMLANERDYSSNTDLRRFLLGDPDWEGNVNFRNNSTATPWGQFQLAQDGTTITSNGQQVTLDTGRFRILPANLAGAGTCTPLPGQPSGICLTNIAGLPDELRFNQNATRTLISDSKRINLFGTIVNEMENGWELYTELGYYTAENRFNNGYANAGPLSHSPLYIPASNYYNPFGALFQSDGVTPNPYRLPGLVGVPDEGLDIPWSGTLGAAYRMFETERQTTVQDESFRIVQGLRGDLKGWDFDTGFVYSESETLDRTAGRYSATAFINTLALDTPLAYNPFNGGGDYIDTGVDGTPNSPDQYNPFTINVDRYSKSSLMLADFKISKPDLFEVPGGDVGFALGAEFRRTTYLDDRDDRLDGTIKYDSINPFGSTLFGDVMGSSPTVDTYGERNVYSVFAELAMPVVNDDMDIPFVKSLDLQLAGRFEKFSDVGSVAKPRIALSWFPVDDFQVRSSYSLGFRAPNLPQVSEGRNSRTVGRADIYFCQAAVNKGLATDLGNCENATLDADPGYLYSEGGVERFTFGSDQLEAETNKSFSVGFTWTPEYIDGLTVTADFWRISQKGIIGVFGTPNNLALDYALRTTGAGSNPNVVREAPTQDVIDFFAGSGLDPIGEAIQTFNPYLNLENRVTKGIDLAVMYRVMDTSAGDFVFNVGATRLLAADQSSGGDAEIINALNNPFVFVAAGGDLLEQQNGRRPKWKASGSATWFYEDFTTTLFGNFIGAVNDTSARNANGDFWRVNSWFTMNTSISYDLSNIGNGSLDGLRFQLGMNNIFDKAPPLADENLGFLTGLHNPVGRYAFADIRYTF